MKYHHVCKREIMISAKALTKMLGVAVVGTGLLALAAPAQALPGSCTAKVVNKTVSAKCSSGTGEFRVWAECINIVGGVGGGIVDSIKYGPWRAVGGTSSTACVQRPPTEWGIEKR